MLLLPPSVSHDTHLHRHAHTHMHRRTHSRVCGVFISIYRCISPTMHTNDLFIYLLIANANDASFSMTQLPHVVALPPLLPPPPLRLLSLTCCQNTHTHTHSQHLCVPTRVSVRVAAPFKFIGHLSLDTLTIKT